MSGFVDPIRGREALRKSRERTAAMSARYEARFPGWKRSRARTANGACPRVVAGKRCLSYGRSWSGCVCTRYNSLRLLDHARLWETPDGERVLTGEPYQLDKGFQELVGECLMLGLSVTVEPYSPYFPGNTMLVLIRRAEAAP